MKLKLKESIRANGVQHLPPAIIDTEEIGITQADADVLVRRGTAEVVVEAPVVETDEQRAEREASEAAAAAQAAAEAEPEVIAVAEPEPAPAPAKTKKR